MDLHIGYCTNVHAGANLGETRANLERHALEVKRRVSPETPMGVGLWLSARASRDLANSPAFGEFADWLHSHGLIPFTLNGFPYGDFHQPVVKHRVYEPNWWQPERLQYTLELVNLQHHLLPPNMTGSISTLPIAWPTPAPRPEDWIRFHAHALELAQHLHRLESETGRYISVCFEPEPGCILQRGSDVVEVFEKYLLRQGHEDILRRYICVCHDVCHAVVMFEEQEDVLRTYRSAGIRVGKMQISSAICVDFDAIARQDRDAAVNQLGQFAEDRYLHQTSVRLPGHTESQFYEDLPTALTEGQKSGECTGEWRTHFHVPVYLERFGRLGASRDQIAQAVRYALTHEMTTHFEVETYAWDVLPMELRQSSLAAGIAAEMAWFFDLLDETQRTMNVQ